MDMTEHNDHLPQIADDFARRTAADVRQLHGRQQERARLLYWTYERPLDRIAEIYDLPLITIERMVLRSMDPSCAQDRHGACVGYYFDEHRRDHFACECECHDKRPAGLTPVDVLRR
jgi:hypothetical protein